MRWKGCRAYGSTNPAVRFGLSTASLLFKFHLHSPTERPYHNAQDSPESTRLHNLRTNPADLSPCRCNCQTGAVCGSWVVVRRTTNLPFRSEGAFSYIRSHSQLLLFLSSCSTTCGIRAWRTWRPFNSADNLSYHINRLSLQLCCTYRIEESHLTLDRIGS